MRVRMTRTLVVSAGALAVGLFLASSMEAGVIAETGFNDASGINADGAAGSPYTLGSDVDAIGQGASESGWTSDWISVYPASGDSNIVSSPVDEGDQALELVSTGSANPGRAVYYRDYTQQTAGTQTIEWSLNAGAINGQMILYVRDQGGSQPIGPQVTVETDGSVTVRDAADTLTAFPAGSITTGSYYDFKVTADIDNETYQLSLNGADSGSTYDFRSTPVAGLGRFQLWNTIDGSAYYDGIVVTIVPEPSSIALLGLSCTVLLGLRLRRVQ